MSAEQSIGMMDGAYFVGRKEILDWLNDLLSLDLAKIEQTASGAVACAVLDSIYPGKIPMHKVNWNAKQDYEFIGNYKVLQSCFNKFKIDKHIEVDRLIRAKYQDNLEFMQWFKRFHELNAGDCEGYDAVAARTKGKGGAVVKYGGKKSSAPAKSRKPAESKPRARPEPVGEKENLSGNTEGKVKKQPSKAATKGRDFGDLQAQNAELKLKMEDVSVQNTELKLTVDGLERERDFYFGKLRDIEILLQTASDQDKEAKGEIFSQIFKILYATEEDFTVEDDAGAEGAVAPEESVKPSEEG